MRTYDGMTTSDALLAIDGGGRWVDVDDVKELREQHAKLAAFARVMNGWNARDLISGVSIGDELAEAGLLEPNEGYTLVDWLREDAKEES